MPTLRRTAAHRKEQDVCIIIENSGLSEERKGQAEQSVSAAFLVSPPLPLGGEGVCFSQESSNDPTGARTDPTHRTKAKRTLPGTLTQSRNPTHPLCVRRFYLVADLGDAQCAEYPTDRPTFSATECAKCGTDRPTPTAGRRDPPLTVP